MLSTNCPASTTRSSATTTHESSPSANGYPKSSKTGKRVANAEVSFEPMTMTANCSIMCSWACRTSAHGSSPPAASVSRVCSSKPLKRAVRAKGVLDQWGRQRAWVAAGTYPRNMRYVDPVFRQPFAWTVGWWESREWMDRLMRPDRQLRHLASVPPNPSRSRTRPAFALSGLPAVARDEEGRRVRLQSAWRVAIGGEEKRGCLEEAGVASDCRPTGRSWVSCHA